MAKGPERDYPVGGLDPGRIPPGVRAHLLGLIERFEPLPFEAGEKAKLWLETNVSAGVLPLSTYFGFSEDESEVFGFFAIDQIEVKVAPGDTPVMQVRHRLDPEAEKQPATKLVWIARSQSSPAGFGAELFDYALALATEAGSCALTVDAYDEETEKMWQRNYDLREPRRGSEEWSCLWHAVGQAPQDFS